MTATGPAWGDRVHVLDGRCATCIYRRGNLMHLQPGRLAGMIMAARERDTVITCHETYEQDPAVCGGFWEHNADRIGPLRIAARLGLIQFDAPPPPDRFTRGRT